MLVFCLLTRKAHTVCACGRLTDFLEPRDTLQFTWPTLLLDLTHVSQNMVAVD